MKINVSCSPGYDSVKKSNLTAGTPDSLHAVVANVEHQTNVVITGYFSLKG